ncbi:unnamed protein product [Amoebophrya sp. A120]|nr:unnamed protein product [Amoebophrya sp. A120]|eukprot:GSA120T00006386001.1
MVLRIYLDGANVGRSRTLQDVDRARSEQGGPPPRIDPKQLWIACSSAFEYFGGQDSGRNMDRRVRLATPLSRFTSIVQKPGRSSRKIEVALRIVFSENTFRRLAQVNDDNKYWRKLVAADQGRLFLKAPNREDDDEWLLSRAEEDWERGDTVAIITADNYDKWKTDHPHVVPRCLMKYCYDDHEHRFTLKLRDVDERLDREFHEDGRRVDDESNAARSNSRASVGRRVDPDDSNAARSSSRDNTLYTSGGRGATARARYDKSNAARSNSRASVGRRSQGRSGASRRQAQHHRRGSSGRSGSRSRVARKYSTRRDGPSRSSSRSASSSGRSSGAYSRAGRRRNDRSSSEEGSPSGSDSESSRRSSRGRSSREGSRREGRDIMSSSRRKKSDTEEAGASVSSDTSPAHVRELTKQMGRLDIRDAGQAGGQGRTDAAGNDNYNRSQSEDQSSFEREQRDGRPAEKPKKELSSAAQTRSPAVFRRFQRVDQGARRSSYAKNDAGDQKSSTSPGDLLHEDHEDAGGPPGSKNTLPAQKVDKAGLARGLFPKAPPSAYNSRDRDFRQRT